MSSSLFGRRRRLIVDTELVSAIESTRDSVLFNINWRLSPVSASSPPSCRISSKRVTRRRRRQINTRRSIAAVVTVAAAVTARRRQSTEAKVVRRVAFQQLENHQQRWKKRSLAQWCRNTHTHTRYRKHFERSVHYTGSRVDGGSSVDDACRYYCGAVKQINQI